MTQLAPETRLRDLLLSGIAADISRAEQAYLLAEQIGAHAVAVNAKGLGGLFGPLQAILSEHQTLAIAKLFERHSARHQLRSIPAVLRLLESHAGEWSLPQRSDIERVLIRHGRDRALVRDLTSEQLTQAIVEHYSTTLPSTERATECQLSAALEKLRVARNKAIAHNEVIDEAARRRATWGEATSLVAYAKEFVAVIGWSYLSIAFSVDDGRYLLTTDAGMPARALLRLLRMASIVPPVDYGAV